MYDFRSLTDMPLLLSLPLLLGHLYPNGCEVN